MIDESLTQRGRPVIGSGITFDDRGTHDLKGVLGQWRLYAVAS
jgi:hypothetical protein